MTDAGATPPKRARKAAPSSAKPSAPAAPAARPSPAASITGRIPARSMGLKLLLVCFLALIMSIPALAVFGILNDRTNRAEQVVDEIGGLIGGPQTFLGPVLSVPYSILTPAAGPGQPASVTTGAYIIFPETGSVSATVDTSVRKRGLFKATVWSADLAFASSFDLSKIAGRPPLGATLDWSRAELLIGASEPRGAQSNIVVTAGGETWNMMPALSLNQASVMAEHDRRRRHQGEAGQLKFFGANAARLATAGARFDVTAKARFSGAERIAILPHGKTTTFRAVGDWTAPSYDGGFLPIAHTPTAQAAGGGAATPGFTANWSVPVIARSAPGDGTSEVISQLGAASLGVTFADQANPYQAVQRSLKYALMFVGLVFLAYFLFETVQKKRVHPAQYVLIGLAQIIFYLLLLSLAERIGFDLGFLISAAATVALISAYAGWVFDSRRQGWAALAAFTALYGLIYILMRLEDWALLVGAMTSFAAIGAVMYFTRRLDWYGADRHGEGVA